LRQGLRAKLKACEFTDAAVVDVIRWRRGGDGKVVGRMSTRLASMWFRSGAETTGSRLLTTLAAGGIALALAVGSGLLISSSHAEGKSMSDLQPIEVYGTNFLVDLTSLSYVGTPYLVTIEHSYQASEPWNDSRAFKTLWRFWKWDDATKGFHQVSENVVGMPGAQAASAVISNHRLLTLLESNQEHAGFLGTWKI